jgi:hypothetical protein
MPFSSADGDYIVTTMTKAILHHDGKVPILKKPFRQKFTDKN